MAHMIFPRATIKVGRCIAILITRPGGNAKWNQNPVPYLNDRPTAKYKGQWWPGARLSFHLNNSNIPRRCNSRTKGFVLHTCDHRWCINPKHLYLGTASQNTIDIYARNPTIRAKRSVALKGKPKSKAHRKALSDYWTGRPKPWLKGRSVTEMRRRKRMS